MNLSIYKNKAKDQMPLNKSLAQKLKKKKPKDLDFNTSQFHDEVFEKIDCLACANCCKTISPIISDNDIKRIAKHLKTKPSDFVELYLNLDQEGDYVFKKQPCPFLGSDNYCSIYPFRPKACAEYPHTDRRRFFQILDLSVRNTLVCPAVTEVFENLRKVYP
jgi:Fe-S-cluster containining protein